MRRRISRPCAIARSFVSNVTKDWSAVPKLQRPADFRMKNFTLPEGNTRAGQSIHRRDASLRFSTVGGNDAPHQGPRQETDAGRSPQAGPSTVSPGETGVMREEHKFVIVHEGGDGWTLGRPGDPFLRFDT